VGCVAGAVGGLDVGAGAGAGGRLPSGGGLVAGGVELVVVEAGASAPVAGDGLAAGGGRSCALGAGAFRSRLVPPGVVEANWKLGLLSSGHVLEVAAADLKWTEAAETGTAADKIFGNAAGGVLMINGADDWHRLPDRGSHVARQLYAQLTEYRKARDDQVAVILTGQADPLGQWLGGHPQLAARFLAVIGFPSYTPAQLTAVFGKLADEAGLRLTAGARKKSADVLEQAERADRSGNARLAVRLLNEARAAQAHRVARGSTADRDLAALVTITEADIPERLVIGAVGCDADRPSPYL
jgi:hypothetical protein